MKCDVEECFEMATVRAYKYIRPIPTDGSPGYTGYYCERHAKEAVADGQPEYVARCPCCSCLFGFG